MGLLHKIKRSITTLALVFFIIQNGHAQKDFEDITFGKHRIVHSEIMDEDRLLYVNLPSDYESSNESYPVLFQLYGHFKESYYLPAVRTMSQMQSLGEAPGVIVVGIKNQQFRYRDLLPVDHNQTKSEIDNFLKFFEEELIPFINKNYRTNGYHILAGPQAGATFGIYALAKKPQLFNAFFLSSPFFIQSVDKPIMEVLKVGINQNSYDRKFVMITYKEGINDKEKQLVDSLSQILNKHASFECIINPIENNSDFNSPVGMIKGMKTLFGKYKFPGDDIPKALNEIEMYYQKLSDKYGYDMKIPEHGLVFEGDKFVKNDELEKAREIFLKMLELYPERVMAPDRLGTIAYKQGNYELALEYYNKFLLSMPDSPYAQSQIKKIKEALEKN